MPCPKGPAGLSPASGPCGLCGRLEGAMITSELEKLRSPRAPRACPVRRSHQWSACVHPGGRELFQVRNAQLLPGPTSTFKNFHGSLP